MQAYRENTTVLEVSGLLTVAHSRIARPPRSAHLQCHYSYFAGLVVPPMARSVWVQDVLVVDRGREHDTRRLDSEHYKGVAFHDSAKYALSSVSI